MKKAKQNKWGLWLMFAFYALILFIIIYSAYTKNLPSYLGRIPHYDTMGHFVLYGLATYLGHRVFQKRKIPFWKYSLPLFPTLFTVFTLVEECLQSLSPNRTLSLLDLVASFIGIGFAYWVVEKYHNN